MQEEKVKYDKNSSSLPEQTLINSTNTPKIHFQVSD